MLFSKNKKLQGDRDAGLVFRWRGGYRSNRGGATIAFFLTSMIFVGGFVMLSVYTKPNTIPNRYRARMIQLGEVDDDLIWRIEKNSPSLPGLLGDEDERSEIRVDNLFKEEINETQISRYLYEDVEMKEIEIDSGEVYLLRTQSMPSLGRLVDHDYIQEGSDEQVKWRVVVTADSVLKARLPDDLEYYDRVPEEWHGLSVRLIVAVDDEGKVFSVNSVDWSEGGEAKILENWVYTIPFKTVKDKSKRPEGMVTGVLDFQLMAVLELGVKEGRP